MSTLETRALSYSHSGQPPLLHDVNIRVERGEFALVIGANGSGKSTLLQLMSGVLLPTSGSIIVDDLPVAKGRDRVGLVLQDPDHQMIAATVEEEIALGLEFRGMDRPTIQRRVSELVTRFSLECYRDKAPELLSGGQKQRVALAAILASEPSFILLDEPDSYLDAPSRRELLKAVQMIRDDHGFVWAAPRLPRDLEADSYYLLADAELTPLARDQLGDALAAGYRVG